MNEYSFIFQINRATRRFPIRIKGKTNDKHHRILEAAVKVFAEKGFFQSTISQIAKEAGVADGTIYLYFKNKDDILTQFFSYKTKLVFDRFKEAVEEGPNAIEKLRNLIRKHLEEFQRDRNMAVVYQTETHQITRMAEYQIKKIVKEISRYCFGNCRTGPAGREHPQESVSRFSEASHFRVGWWGDQYLAAF